MKSVWYIFTMFFTFLYFTYYGMLAVAITLSYQVAAVVASASTLFSISFCVPHSNTGELGECNSSVLFIFLKVCPNIIYKLAII